MRNVGLFLLLRWMGAYLLENAPMTRRHTIETERIAEDDGGEFVAASLAIEFYEEKKA